MLERSITDRISGPDRGSHLVNGARIHDVRNLNVDWLVVSLAFHLRLEGGNRPKIIGAHVAGMTEVHWLPNL